jgi:hypothetical protein
LDFPDRQAPRGFREKSTEHKFLTTVFGTAQPLKGLSGVIRRYAYTYRTRFGQHRADLKHQPLDLVLWAAPYIALAGGAYLAARDFKERA